MSYLEFTVLIYLIISYSTSNWSKKHLSPQQIAYATADAYAPVLVFEELRRLGLAPNTSGK